MVSISSVEEERPQYLRVRDIVRIYLIHERTVYQWIYDGRFPVTRMGRSIRVLKSDFEAFAQRHRAGTHDSGSAPEAEAAAS